MKFKKMPYQRLDFSEMKRNGQLIIEDLRAATGYDQARKALINWQGLLGKISTQNTLASVRHEIDTQDVFYDQEQQYWDRTMPELEETFQTFTQDLLHSPFRAEFEKEFGNLLFRNAEIQLKTFSPVIVPELQEENRLTTEYNKLMASAQIMFDKELRTLSQMTPYKQAVQDQVRKDAWIAEGRFYAEHQDELDAIYDKLVKVRTAMAQKLGYHDYVELGYYRMMRNSYDQSDISRFRTAVIKYLVPLAEELKKEQARRIGSVYPMSFDNDALAYRSGNAKPFGTPEQILAHGKKMYHEMAPETAEFIDFMYENELLDVLSKKGKAGGGFCTAIEDYKSPFIFANFNGTQHDVEVMTHEAGHAFAAYMARDIQLLDYRNPTLESCEIHSMSMEFFAWPWAEGFFGNDTKKFYYSHLEGALTFIPYGTMVDHFQHIVYQQPELTPDQRHAEWKKLERLYRPWMKIADLPFYGDGKGWQRQQHIYNSPFYYIDYCLAQAVALQFWSGMQLDRQKTWMNYLALVKKAGTMTFTQLVETAGLESPFGDSGLARVAEVANNFLSAFDKSQIK
ncbi:MAG: M3 family oligoendopeptidase [Erysipelotrichaceae bacterium]|nr:M3 family oligoendopeptidase [Erysipelotrichaceae bacterium]